MSSDISKIEKAEAEIKQEQRKLAANAWHLARYVIEHDQEINFPENFDPGEFVNWAESYPKLSPKK